MYGFDQYGSVTFGLLNPATIPDLPIVLPIFNYASGEIQICGAFEMGITGYGEEPEQLLTDFMPNYLPGNPPMYGVKQQADQYYQGVDIIIDAQLAENGTAVDYNDYFLKAVLKADLDSPTVVWSGHANYGLFFVDGRVQVNIPANITNQLPAGVYYLAIIGKSKTNINHIAMLFNKTISIALSAASSINLMNYDVGTINPTGVVVHPKPTIPDVSVDISYFSI